ncbi:MAG TPA: lipopolysaccharide kinase InaA family protein [Tepidisphaeraceae bacterium]|nr:lipopolysaccharide kinase InaA family protein [Tepidisphaeraceae bacterium]
MSPDELEQALKNLPQTGKLIKNRSYRQVWRFECAGQSYYLKFYPRAGFRNRFSRLFRGSKALNEFNRLQRLQKAGVSAARGVVSLMGMTINGRKGDAVILKGIEPAVQLDHYLNQHALNGQDVPDHHSIVLQILDILEKLGRAGLGHTDLHLGNFLLKDGRVYLLDGYAVHQGGLTMRDIQLLALSASPHLTHTDLYRAWKRLGPGGPLPRTNARGPSLWRHLVARTFKEERYHGRLQLGDWQGHFFKCAKFPQRWSTVSRLDITEKDWRQAWPLLLQQMESDQFEVLKRSPSGDVLAGEIILGGRPVPVVVKCPRRRYWYRYFNEIGRGSRSRRAWTKAWQLIVRNVPTAWPLLLMERRKLGYVTDSLTVFERIPGQALSSPTWAARSAEAYHTLLQRVGRLLRAIEQVGLFFYDSKSSNWMIRDDPALGLTPMLIDTDGVRRIKCLSRGGFNRLLRSLRENPGIPFSREDALALARGYSPYATAAELERLCHLQPATQSPLVQETNRP